MKMLSERGFNIHMFPMIQRRGRVFEGEYIRKNSKGKTVFVATENSRWNLRCYKFMDWLSSKIRNRFDEYVLAEFPEEGLIKSCNDQRIGDKCCLLYKPSWFLDILNCLKGNDSSYKMLSQNYQWNPTIPLKQIAKELGWEKSHVIKVIETIRDCKVRFSYQIKTGILSNDSKNFTFKNFSYVPEEFESFFNIEIKDGSCTFKFNTGLGLCFIHNLLTGGYELIDENLYKLSESSQIVYRQRLFTYSNMITTITKNYVFNLLGITGKNKTNNNSLFKKVIEELIEYKLIVIKDKKDSNHYIVKKYVRTKEERKILNFPKKVQSNLK